MRRNLFYFGVIFVLLSFVAATPTSVLAEGDPPPSPEPVKPPWITGINPSVSLSTAEQEELTPAGIIAYSQGVEVPLMAAPPDYVDLDQQIVVEPLTTVNSLAVPQRYQDPSDVTCGAAALGMALDFLSLNGEGQAPSQATLVNDLNKSGLLYDTGTGVEELTYLARQYGFQGSAAFHDWTLAQLGEQLAGGKPVVVSLGTNGEDQVGHFVTLTGISEDGKRVSYNDPVLGKQTVSADEFQKLWDLQGRSGLVVQKEALPSSVDPMLPWMGLFSAMAMLAVMAKQVPLGEQITDAVADIRGLLSSPSRKGLGGKLIVEGGSTSAPPYTAPPGYHWTKLSVPKYGWKNIQIIEKVQVPNIVKTYGVIKTNTWIEKTPIYTTVKVDKGHWAYRTVKKYRTERYRTTERYKTKKYYWYRRNGRLVRGSYDVWKTRTVVKTRKVPYYDREKYWVKKIVTEEKLVRIREVVHRDPVYGWKEEYRGTRTVERTKTTRSWAPVGTKTEWKLKKDPLPTPTPPNPTPTPNDPTPTQTPLVSSTTAASTLTDTQWPTVTSSVTPSVTYTSSPTTTPTSQYNYIYHGTNTPAPPTATKTPVPEETQMARREEAVTITKTTSKGLLQTLKLMDSKTINILASGWAQNGWAMDKQTPGIISTALAALSLFRKTQGASEDELGLYKYGANLSNFYATTRVAYIAHADAALPSLGEVINKAGQAAASQPGVTSSLGAYGDEVVKGFVDELAVIGEKYIPTLRNPLANVAARGAQILGSFAGVIAGGLQIRDATKRFSNEDQHDEVLGFAQTLGGLSTIAGSGIALGAAATFISAPAIIGAAPLLLGAGAIIAGGALAYDLLKDTTAVKNLNQNIETKANRSSGYVDDAIESGQSLVERGVPPALAVPIALYGSALEQSNEAVLADAKDLFSGLKSGFSDIKEDISQIFN